MRYAEGYLDDLREAASDLRLAAFDGQSVLVTGATGLIGSALADVLLCRNVELGGSVRLTLAGRDRGRVAERFLRWGNEALAFEHYDALAAFEPAGSYDYVIHCAANAHPGAYAAEPVETAWVIAYGAREMLEALRRQGSGRLLLVSSSEVYGTRPGTELYGEGDYAYVDVTSPRSCYPSAKRLAETLCAAYAAEYGVDVVTARPGHVYGPQITLADTRAHASFARDAAAGRDIVMKSAGNQLRSYTYSLDCATALLAVLLHGEGGQAYNVSNPGSIVTIRQLAEALAEAGGASVRFELPTEGESAAYNPMTCSALDSSKLEALGWQGAYDLARGAGATVEGLRG